MPQIGWFEILIIAAIAIIVVGPKDFPIVLKKIGSWIGSIKKSISNMQKEVSNFSDDNFEEKPKESNTETKDNVKK
jgi:sec-independent protein translocase protein TatB